ncbi:MAG: glycosyltransferase family 2 protein [Paludibacter sp.]|nr:glycosyltransferase family 2 protein [Paludibacter sp.]
MKVSIITIVLNNKSFIESCIQSVRNQTYHEIEHIIIDGGSTDGTQKQIEPYQNDLAYYKSEVDNGPYEALNKGISQATGNIIGILHSDDLFYDTTTVEKMVDVFKKTNADLVYANGQYVDKENTNKVKRIYSAKPFHKIYLHFGWVPLHTTIYVKKEVFEKYGMYKTKYSIAGDYGITLGWFTNDQIKKVFFNEWVVKMRMGGKSTTASLQKVKSTEDLQIIKLYKLWGVFTLGCKITRKIPQYLMPRLIKYK